MSFSICFVLNASPCLNRLQSSAFCAVIMALDTRNDSAKGAALRYVAARSGYEQEADGERMRMSKEFTLFLIDEEERQQCVSRRKRALFHRPRLFIAYINDAPMSHDLFGHQPDFAAV